MKPDIPRTMNKKELISAIAEVDKILVLVNMSVGGMPSWVQADKATLIESIGPYNEATQFYADITPDTDSKSALWIG